MLTCPACGYTVMCCNSLCPRCGSQMIDTKLLEKKRKQTAKKQEK